MMPYIAHAGLILAGCFIFYKLLLQKETFFRANRWLLLACLVISFGLPLIPVPQQWSFREAPVVTTEPTQVFDPMTYDGHAELLPPATTPAAPATVAAAETKSPSINWTQVLTWVGYLYWFGVIVFGLNLVLQLVTLLYRAYASPVIRDGRFRIVELTGDKAPCSFWNNIFLNPAKYDWETYNQILLHEKVHIQQGHSLDLLLAEVVIVFQWFNPFAWQYRKALENNLEYLTDEELLHDPQIEKDSYQLSLLKVSAPHFPLHLTTNYNQSLLKKRIAMMNVKKSNVHTAWKYGFLLPVLVLLVCLLNKPVAMAQASVKVKTDVKSDVNVHVNGPDTEGVWFATIKDDKVSIQFRNEDNDYSTNSNSFLLSDLGTLPRESSGIFTVRRDAGTMEFTGRFEGNQGMGRYKFTADKTFAADMAKEGVELRNEKDQLVFFFVNVNKAFVQMMKDNGYKDLKRGDLIPLAALKVDGPWIQSIRKSGIGDLTARNLVPLKALGVTGEYISEIRNAGYPNITTNQIISFKSQGIDAKYIADVRSAAGALPKPAASKDDKNKDAKKDVQKDEEVSVSASSNPQARANASSNVNVNVNTDISVNDIISIKALNITPEYIKSLKDAGFDNLSNNKIVSLKAQGVTGEYIKGLRSAGFKDLTANDIISFKAQSITPEFAQSIREAGFNDITNNQLISMKVQGITADYIKSLKANGFKSLTPNDVVSVKVHNITPEFIKGFEDMGFHDITPSQAVSLKVMGVTADFIKGFKDIGYTDISPNKAVSLKSQSITPALVKEYKQLGFEDVSLNQVVSAKATGTTPAFIASMKEKGHDLKSLQKYIQLKTVLN